MGFTIYATAGTADWLNKLNIPATAVNKVSEGSPHVVDLITRGQVHMLINTPLGRTSFADSQAIRAAAVMNRVPLLTTLSAAAAAVQGIRATKQKEFRVRSLQTHHNL
jgi:carbamoyl-phosphate synthase large subunit